MLDRHIQRRIEVRRMPTDQAFAGPYLTSEAKLLRSASANLGCPSSVIAHSVPALEREDKFRGRRAGPACYKAASRLRPGGAPGIQRLRGGDPTQATPFLSNAEYGNSRWSHDAMAGMKDEDSYFVCWSPLLQIFLWSVYKT